MSFGFQRFIILLMVSWKTKNSGSFRCMQRVIEFYLINHWIMIWNNKLSRFSYSRISTRWKNSTFHYYFFLSFSHMGLCEQDFKIILLIFRFRSTENDWVIFNCDASRKWVILRRGVQAKPLHKEKKKPRRFRIATFRE